MDVFTALADPVRRDLLSQMAAGTARVVDLAAHHSVSRPAISKHLRGLTEAGLVVAEDRGRERHYRIDHGGLEPVDALLNQLRAQPPFPESALDGLDLEVRRTGKSRRTSSAPASRNTTEEIA